MKYILRIGASVVAMLVAGAVLLGSWFYTTIPEPPSPPPNLVEEDSTVEFPAVRNELLRMRWVDQTVRKQATDSLFAGKTDATVDLLGALRYFYLENRVDKKNTARLEELVARYGWPDEGRVGAEGAEAAFLIAQHADHDVAFQRMALDSIRQAYGRDQATGQQVALLTDRVRVAESNPQLYGTQAQVRDGEVIFHPIRDSSNVDQRRAKVGLPPLSTYVEKMKAELER